MTERNAIIVHGTPGKEEYYDANVPSGSNHHWLPWLQKQLIVHDVAANTPEIPNAWDPFYPTWQREFERFEIGAQTILVGHSCGSGFILRWLCEHRQVEVDQVILVAPWIDPRRRKTTEFFNFAVDPELAARANRITIFNSDNDDPEIHETVKIIRDNIDGIHYREFHNYGHFCLNDMGTDHFQELLETALSSPPT